MDGWMCMHGYGFYEPEHNIVFLISLDKTSGKACGSDIKVKK